MTLPFSQDDTALAEVRRGSLARRKKAQALAASGYEPWERLGTNLMREEDVQSAAAQHASENRFNEALQAAQLERANQALQYQHEHEQAALRLQGASVDIQRQALMQGRYIPAGQDALGQPVFMDAKTGKYIRVPLPGMDQPIGIPNPTAAPAGAGMMPSHAAAAPPPAAAAAPPAAQSPFAGAPPLVQQMVESNMRRKLPPEVMKELDTADRTEQLINTAIQSIHEHPEAFSGEQAAMEHIPGGLGDMVRGRYRNPDVVAARGAVYKEAVGAMHDMFGARLTDTEFRRSSPFVPGPSDNPPNAIAKLAGGLQAVHDRKAQIRSTYLPLLPPLPETSAPPAAHAAPAGPAGPRLSDAELLRKYGVTP